MPYASEKQRRYLHAKHPEVAARWDQEIRDAKQAPLSGQISVTRDKRGVPARVRRRKRQRNSVGGAVAGAVTGGAIGGVVGGRHLVPLGAVTGGGLGAVAGSMKRVPKSRTVLEVDRITMNKASRNVIRGLERVAPPGRAHRLSRSRTSLLEVANTTTGKTRALAESTAGRFDPNDPRVQYASSRLAARTQGRPPTTLAGQAAAGTFASPWELGRMPPRRASREWLRASYPKPSPDSTIRRANQKTLRELRMTRQAELGKAHDPFEVSKATTGTQPVDQALTIKEQNKQRQQANKQKVRRVIRGPLTNAMSQLGTRRTHGLASDEVNWRYSGAFL